MMNEQQQVKETPLELKPWEFAVLFFETLVADAAVLWTFLVGAPRLLEGVVRLPQAVWAGAGFLAAFWVTVPIMGVYLRARRQQTLPLARLAVGSIVGSVVGGLLFTVLS